LLNIQLKTRLNNKVNLCAAKDFYIFTRGIKW
jgi:hypothetical protein